MSVGWLGKLTGGLRKSAQRVSEPLKNIFSSKKLDVETLGKLEDILLSADFGTATTDSLIHALKTTQSDQAEGVERLAHLIEKRLAPFTKPLTPDLQHKPWTCLFVGVNGSGKTTTVGKLAAQFAHQGLNTSFVAADTFRAASGAQASVWAKRAGVHFMEGTPRSDSAALTFSALEEGRKASRDIVLVDTAGRLQTQKNLMDELSKIVRVMKKQNHSAPHETIVVLDGTVGQNALSQVELFQEAVPLTGMIITKLDGTARAGIVLHLTEKFQLPIMGIGTGEGIDDLIPCDAKAFARQLVGCDLT